VLSKNKKIKTNNNKKNLRKLRCLPSKEEEEFNREEQRQGEDSRRRTRTSKGWRKMERYLKLKK